MAPPALGEAIIHAAINTVLDAGSQQNKDIVKHLTQREGAELSMHEAMLLYRIAALPKRITEIMEYGIPMNRVWKRDTTGRNYMAYSIAWPKEVNG